MTSIQNNMPINSESDLSPQTIDLKHPENFVSFFHKVIEPKLQAKNSVNPKAPPMTIPTNTFQNFQTSSTESIRLLRPSLTTQQVSPTQQQFQLDIPFAKSASSDPNCKIPNGATVGISFTFF